MWVASVPGVCEEEAMAAPGGFGLRRGLGV